MSLSLILGVLAVLIIFSVFASAWMERRYPRRTDRYWRETFSEALDRKDARIEELERENDILRSRMLPSQQLSVDSILKFERQKREES